MQQNHHPSYEHLKSQLLEAATHFNDIGEVLQDSRNTVKVIEIDGERFNYKRFKVPGFINKLVYRFFRKSKAQRSFEYAQRLLENGIGTPQPVAYFLELGPISLGSSFYISKQYDADFTFRDLIQDDHIPDKEAILRAYTRFLYKMHESGIYFMDNSLGNTLIKVKDDGYEFVLVDLNRMKFYQIPWQDRMLNFARLSPVKWPFEIMGDEYSTLSRKRNPQQTIDDMWQHAQDFQYKFARKKRYKKRFKAFLKG